MRVVKLKGGLGNQMFQYAFAKYVEKKTSDDVKLDYSAYNVFKDDIRVPRIKSFDLSLEEAAGQDLKDSCIFNHCKAISSLSYKIKIFLEKTLNHDYYFEKNRAWVDFCELKDKLYYDGYWQSWRYVSEVADELRRDFIPKNNLSEKSESFIKKIENENSVFVGVRRGDYLKEKEHYGSFPSEYYEKAMDIIEDETESPIFYIFSNDIEWCKTNLNFGKHKVVFREKEEQTSDFEELIIMSRCKNAVIVNSSFNWWGAWLIDNPKKIICCPDKWFFDDSPIDIIPPEWRKVEWL